MIPSALAPALLMLGASGQADGSVAPGTLAAVQITLPPVVPTIEAPAIDEGAAPVAPQPAQAGTPPAGPQLAGQASDEPHAHIPGDPLEGFNRKMFGLFHTLDERALRPAALGYRHVVPKPVRGGLRHFFSNLGEPLVFLNYLLQFKPGKAFETLGRFVINSTLGIGGLIDIAKTRDFRLPHRPNSFGNTLAIYGVKPGPYIFLPFVGPTTLRDLLGGQGEGMLLPMAIGNPFGRLEYQIPRAAVSGLDQRAESDDDLQALYAGAVDPYASLRSSFLQDRQGEIDRIRGRSTRTAAPELDDPLADPEAKAPPAGDTPASPAEADPADSVAAHPPEPQTKP